MANLMNFLDSMIENTPKELQICGDEVLKMSNEQQAGFKVACILIKSMIELNPTFRLISNKDE